MSGLAFLIFFGLVVLDGLAEEVGSVWSPFALTALLLIVVSFIVWVAETIRTS